jgi:GNAT superfamily N-acetyltransferase
MSTNPSSTTTERWNNHHPRWPELMSLKDIEDLHLEEKAEEWHLGIYTLVALEDTQIVGVLRFWTQVIGVDEDKPPSIVDGEPAVEAKIVTFHVLDEFRRRGIGRSLELAAVGWARDLGCYQVRTRSAYNRTGNHGLKASLGFGISPGRNRPDGAEDTAFFILPLRLAPELVPPQPRLNGSPVGSDG